MTIRSMTNDSEHTEENVIKDNALKYILVFTPYHPYYHLAYYAYDPERYGTLGYQTAVSTTMGVGMIVKEEIPKETLPPQIVEIFGPADEQQTKKINKDWWQCIETIHEIMNEADR